MVSCSMSRTSQVITWFIMFLLSSFITGYTYTHRRMSRVIPVQRRDFLVFASSNGDAEENDSGYMVRPYGPGSGGPVGMFGGRGGLISSISADRELSDVLIEAPSMQSRRITATILVEDDVDEVWKVLTDYNNLAVHVPNLVQSYVVEGGNRGGRYDYRNPNFGETGGNSKGVLFNEKGAPIVTDVTIFQEGAQKILGFDFRASLKMDMKAAPPSFSTTSEGAVTSRKLTFTLADSFMFSAFDGSWTVGAHSREMLSNGKVKVRSQLTYSVLVKPRGPVPVAALEWRIKEDVPVNLKAVKKAVEAKAYYSLEGRSAPSNRKSSLPLPPKTGKGVTATRMAGRISKEGQPSSTSATNNRGGKGGRGPLDNQGYWDADETLENYLA